MLDGNLLGLVPFVLIVFIILGMWCGGFLNRWLMRIGAVVMLVAGFACLGFVGPWLAYDIDYQSLSIAPYVSHEVFNSLMFNACGGLLAFSLGVLIRSISRGATPEADMMRRENANKRSVKMAVMDFCFAAVFLGFAALALWSYLSIEDHVHVKMPLFPYLVTWCPALAGLFFFLGRSSLYPNKQIPSLYVDSMLILLIATAIFACMGIEL